MGTRVNAHTHTRLHRTGEEAACPEALKMRPRAKRRGLDGIQPKEQGVPSSGAGVSWHSGGGTRRPLGWRHRERRTEPTEKPGQTQAGHGQPDGRFQGLHVFPHVQGKSGGGSDQMRAPFAALRRGRPRAATETTRQARWEGGHGAGALRPRGTLISGKGSRAESRAPVSAEQLEGGSCPLRTRGVPGCVHNVKG